MVRKLSIECGHEQRKKARNPRLAEWMPEDWKIQCSKGEVFMGLGFPTRPEEIVRAPGISYSWLGANQYGC